MPMMQVREVRMPVRYRLVLVLVGMRLRVMRLDVIPREGMRVPMMLIVDVRMRMLERVMRVLVLMVFGQVQPHTGCHQCG